MTGIAMPAPDADVIARRADIVKALRAIVREKA